MSDHQIETAFRRHCLSYDESPRLQELEARITQIQRDGHCVHRAVWLMALLVALSAATLGYGAALGDNFPYNTSPFITNVICALGVGSLISLLVFVGLRIICHKKLDQRREECRQVIEHLLASGLGSAATTTRRNGPIADGSRGPVPVSGGDNGAPDKL